MWNTGGQLPGMDGHTPWSTLYQQFPQQPPQPQQTQNPWMVASQVLGHHQQQPTTTSTALPPPPLSPVTVISRPPPGPPSGPPLSPNDQQQQQQSGYSTSPGYYGRSHQPSWQQNFRGRGGFGGRGRGGVPYKDDWICRDCSHNNFGWRVECKRCNRPKKGSFVNNSFSSSRGFTQIQRPLPQSQQEKFRQDGGAEHESQLSEQELQFDKMFSAWEETFETWKRDNENNPDRKYVEKHIAEMNRMKEQMLLRRENLRKQRMARQQQQRPQQCQPHGVQYPQEQQQHERQRFGKEEEQTLRSEKTSRLSRDMDLGSGNEEDQIQEPFLLPRRESSSKVIQQPSRQTNSSCSSGIPGIGDGKDEYSAAESTSGNSKLTEKDLANISRVINNMGDPEETERTGVRSWNSGDPPQQRPSPPLFYRKADLSWEDSNWKAEEIPFPRRSDEDYWRPDKTIDYHKPPTVINYDHKRPESLSNSPAEYRSRSPLGNNRRSSSSINSFGDNSRYNRCHQHEREENRFGNRYRRNERSINYRSPTRAMNPSSLTQQLPPHHVPPPPLIHLAQPPPGPQIPPPAAIGDVVEVDEILQPPGRYVRPPKIVIIFRGLPGSGKTFIAKNIKTQESYLGSEAPRILSLDDYFECDGKYEYEAELEDSYRQSLIKSFKKQIDDGYFSFIMVDCINDKTRHYEEMWSYAKQNGFEVYVAEIDADVHVCVSRNIHSRKEDEIANLNQDWEPTPIHYNKLDLRTMLQEKEIEQVEMADANDDKADEDEESQESAISDPFKLSKWEIMDKEDRMAQLDGTSEKAKKKFRQHRTIEDWLELSDSFKVTSSNIKGKKRVRWADIEERREEAKMRDVGFIVGQINWNRMLRGEDPGSALTRTKIIPNRFQDY